VVFLYHVTLDGSVCISTDALNYCQICTKYQLHLVPYTSNLSCVVVKILISPLCCSQDCQFQFSLERLVVTMVSFSMSGMCGSQYRQFHHVRNVLDETDDNDTAQSIHSLYAETDNFGKDTFKPCRRS
jgi:hypothetical protein